MSITGEWIKKIWDIHMKEYYSALEEKEILPFMTTWMNLEDIMLSEISHSQKRQILLKSIYMRNHIAKLIETETTIVVARG